MTVPWKKQTSAPPTGDQPNAKRMWTPLWRQAFLIIGILALIGVLIFAVAVAWYTNVTRTNGLQFKTEAWGFSEDNITIGSGTPGEKLSIELGKTGDIPLHVDNSGNYQTVKAVVNADKTTMGAELRKRVYFYVDRQMTVSFGEGTDPETTARQYLGMERTDSYTYTILGGGALSLSAEYANDSPLKWQWVDTLEGYYFRGKVSNSPYYPYVTVTEYLRPIEYDLDRAVFDTDEEDRPKTLKTVNKNLANEQTLDEFLTAIFASDGYPGGYVAPTELQPSDMIVEVDGRRYYKIDVKENEDGTMEGVWAYLMDADEIAEANAYDSVNFSEPTELSATVSVTVFNVDTAVTEAGSLSELNAALSDGGSGTIRLTGNVSSAEALTATGERTVDLNGYSLEYTGTETNYSVFQVEEGANLTLINGSIIGNGNYSPTAGTTASTAVSTAGGTATLSRVTVRNFDTAVSVDDHTGAADSEIRLINCDLEARQTAVLLYGNGSASEALSRVVIEDSRIKGSYIGISGNGTSSADKQLWGTELIILNSTVEGYWTAIYQPQQQSRTSITGSELTGYTGIAIKGGTVDIRDSKITGTGAKRAAANASSGWTDTGDAVYVEAGYPWTATAIIRGTDNELESTYGYRLQLFGVEGKGPGTLVSEDETYAPEDVNWNGVGIFAVSVTE